MAQGNSQGRVDIRKIAGTAPTTAGKLDIKGADGDVFVRNATATNLKVEATVAAAQTLATVTTVSTVTNLSQMSGAAIAMGTGVRSAGTQRVTIATDDSVPVTGTFWQATQPVSGTVTANAGTGTFTISGAVTEATLDAAIVSQGTALGTIKNIMTAGSVTTAAPTYTTGNINPLSLTTSGALRVDIGATSANGTAIKVDGSAVTQPVSGTVSITANSAVNVAQINGITPLMGNGVTGTGSQRVTIASDNTAFAVNATLSAETTKVIGVVRTADGSGNLLTSNSTTYTAKFGLDSNLLGTKGTAFTTAGFVDIKGADGDVFVRQATAANLNAQVVGNIAHDGVDSGNPIKVGHKTIAHGTNPTAVAAADRTDWYANRAGVPFVIGGHPNIVTFEAAYTAAQTNTAIVTVATGLKIVVTEIEALCDNANTVNVACRVGFATATTPTTTGVVLTHPGIAPGSGVVRGNGSGILGVGADDEDLRITCGVPTTGSIRILVSYYTIES